jgi:enamine deaminase RidA (YjgF/YER057c/UK114 family)
MWENVGQLLQEANAGHEDIAQILVYLRDPADYERTRSRFTQLAPDIPLVITWAPVCRPTWLIEMECIAIRATHRPEQEGF